MQIVGINFYISLQIVGIQDEKWENTIQPNKK